MLYNLNVKEFSIASGDVSVTTKRIKKADMMVICPHPDDAEFAIAGTVARRVKEGKAVVYVICTNGDKGTSDRNMRPEELVKIREQEQMEAAHVLGVQQVVFMRYPDQSLEDTPEFRKAIVRLIRLYRPDTVAAPNPYRKYVWHRDHRITGQVALDAVYPFARDHLAYPDLLAEGLQPHKVKEVLLWGAEDLNYRSDISSTLDTKLAALRCHKSQISGDRFATTKGRLRRQAEEYAKGEAFALAEAFHRIEILR